VSLPEAAIGIRTALDVCRTLHGWASTLPGATAHQGRATAWGAVLPGDDIPVVVRHAQHGGLLRALTGDRFLAQGRAAYELEVSERLRAARVPTPELVAYVVYPAGPWFSRIDVATRRLPAGDDLPAAWAAANAAERDALVDATAALLRTLERAGALHPDLNAKNIYLSRSGAGTWQAYVLDVDRIRFPSGHASQLGARNLARLVRSLVKWRTRHRLPVTAGHLARLTALAGADAGADA
jgi:3-deoxy-D-manno-octulosonic acid kinase